MNAGPSNALIPHNSLPRIAARFVSGQPLDGIRRSNSTFLSPGTRVVGQPHRDRPSRWMALPGWKRAAWRMGVAVPTVSTPIGLWFAPVATIAADAALTAGGITWGTLATRKAVRMWKHNREWLRPLHTVLAPVLEISRHAQPDTYIDVPIGFQQNEDAQITVQIPTHFEGDQTSRARVLDIIKTRLALQDVDVSWRLSGPEPTLTIRHAPKPPERITWEEALPLMANASESAPLIGVGQRGRLIAIDLDSESPHILLSMSTGAGKSVFARGMAAQILARGGEVVICDIKRVSHRWARGLEGVTYARDPEEIHDVLIRVAAEGHNRFGLIDQDKDEEVARLPRVLLIIEEMNATIGKLTRLWAAMRDKEDPKQSPAIEALGDVLFMGRQARIHVLAIGQLMTARALGGPEMRECFSTRVLARYTVNAWKMLVPEVWPAPKSSRHPGRVQLVYAGEAHATQVIYGTEDQAREFVLANRTAVTTSHSTVDQGTGHVTVPGFTGPAPAALRLVKGGAEDRDPNAPIGLRTACRSGLVSLSDTPEKTLTILRAARARDPEFPLPVRQEGQEKLYLPDELVRWARNRPRAAGAES